MADLLVHVLFVWCPRGEQHLKKLGGENTYLRVLVEGGGCSGFTYKFEMDSTINKDDRYAPIVP